MLFQIKDFIKLNQVFKIHLTNWKFNSKIK